MIQKEKIEELAKKISTIFRATHYEHEIVKFIYEYVVQSLKDEDEAEIFRQSDSLLIKKGNPKLVLCVHTDLPLFLEGYNGSGKTKLIKSLSLVDAKGNDVHFDALSKRLSVTKFPAYPYQPKINFEITKDQIKGAFSTELIHLCLSIELLKTLPEFCVAFTQGYYENNRGIRILLPYIDTFASTSHILALEPIESDRQGKGAVLSAGLLPQRKALDQINKGNQFSYEFEHTSIQGKALDEMGSARDWVCIGLPIKNLHEETETVLLKDYEKLSSAIKELSQWTSV